MSSPSQPTAACTGGFLALLECGSGGASASANTSARTLATTIAASFISLGIQLLVFVLLRLRLSRIYRPRTYLVPERERTAPPPGGLIGWVYPLLTVSNKTIIEKCGLDAYFFLRYLRALLKIFLPAALVVLPILLPVNVTGKGTAKGLDALSISNIGMTTVSQRLWAQLILAILVILWIFYVVFRELRSYIRIRQAFLTSPQHRIRASATTVLVTGIPRKWMTMEALSGLYDVFPGGIRNIWINRNYSELADKVSMRDKYAKALEGAETDLIKACRKSHVKKEKERRKKERGSKMTKEQEAQAHAEEDAAAQQMTKQGGVSAGAQYDMSDEKATIIDDDTQPGATDTTQSRRPFGFVGQGFGAVGQGLGAVGKGVGNLTSKMVGGVGKVNDNLFRGVDAANDGGLGGGFADDDDLYRRSVRLEDSVPPTIPEGGRVDHRPQPESNRSYIYNGLPTHSRTMSNPPRPHGLPVASDGLARLSPESEKTLDGLDADTTRSSSDQKPAKREKKKKKDGLSTSLWQRFIRFLHVNDEAIVLPSPQPHVAEEDGEFPFGKTQNGLSEPESKTLKQKLMFWKGVEKEEKYPDAFHEDLAEDGEDDEPLWRKYIETKDRPTMRLPLLSFMPAIPFVGKKVDSIYFLRRQLARLNVEIEQDQATPEKFPLMNSAFIQFNHQIAAHMCCQSLSHHIPQQMAPRLLEIGPNDVIWDNMAITWWERYIRTGVVLAISAALIVFYAIPVAFTSLLYNVESLGAWWHWLLTLPDWAIAAFKGVVPPVLLSIILSLVPLIFQLLIKQQGVPTGSMLQQNVQSWYFTFLFIQVFLVVTISGGLINLFKSLANNPINIATKVATSFPTAADYFFSYLTLQALSSAASSLAQVGALFSWFILAPLLDSTARAKWTRQTKLSTYTWGTFFPTFTNFAVIGIIYSVLAPLILVFMIVIFSTFLIAYRYSVLYTVQFKNDTGGLLFPVALQQLFVGVYFLELCLIGIFFTQHDENGDVACIPQGVIMVVVLVLTVIGQWLLNADFAPLLQYLPITLEDEAVVRDEAFAKQQESKFAALRDTDGNPNDDDEDIEDTLKRREEQEQDENEAAEEAEQRDIALHRRSGTAAKPPSTSIHTTGSRSRPWHQRALSKPTWKSEKWKSAAPEAVARLRYLADGKPVRQSQPGQGPGGASDVEAQRVVGDVLFSGYADELEDLDAEDRDLLVRYAFQHSALRARRPVVWIPRDRLGVSDDEILRAKRMSTVVVDENGEKGGKEQTFIWMSNEGTALDSKGRVVFGRSPPDFSNVDLITL